MVPCRYTPAPGDQDAPRGGVRSSTGPELGSRLYTPAGDDRDPGAEAVSPTSRGSLLARALSGLIITLFVAIPGLSTRAAAISGPGASGHVGVHAENRVNPDPPMRCG
jgi:hypothetical protein